MKAEQITDAVAYHGEGPVWSEAWGGLRWVDMLAGDVLQLGADGGIVRQHVGTVAAVVRPRTNGGAIVALEDRFAITDGDLSELRELPKALGSHLRFNEGGCDPDGRFYCGSLAWDGSAKQAAFYRLDAAEDTMSPIFAPITTSNGFGFSPDHSLAYYIDTRTLKVDVCDYVDGELRDRRTFVEIEGGGPDGLTVDAEGCVWLALYGGSAVRRYRPDGTLDGVVELPTKLVTACTFGGPDLDELYITTSQQRLEPGSDPLAGALFRVRPGVRGMPVLPYAG